MNEDDEVLSDGSRPQTPSYIEQMRALRNGQHQVAIGRLKRVSLLAKELTGSGEYELYLKKVKEGTDAP